MELGWDGAGVGLGRWWRGLGRVGGGLGWGRSALGVGRCGMVGMVGMVGRGVMVRLRRSTRRRGYMDLELVGGEAWR